MKILLVQSYLGRREPVVFPLGLCNLATVLADRHEVQVLDMNICEHPYRELEKVLVSFSPGVVGISVRNIDSVTYNDIFYYYKTLNPTLELIRRAAPDARTVVGGSGFSLYAEKIMRRNPLIDFGVFLEAEESLPELVTRIDSPSVVKGIFVRSDNEIRFTGPRTPVDFASLPMTRREFLPVATYFRTPFSMGIETKRGCSLRCAYCTYPFLNGSAYRLRPPEKVAEEVEYLTRELKAPNFIFVDSVFNIPLDHAQSICSELTVRKTGTPWLAWYNEKNLDLDFMKQAIDAGCIGFSFSPDGLTDASLRGLDKNLTEADVMRGYELVNSLEGAAGGYNFFVNPPGQDFRGLLKLLLFYVKTRVLRRGKFKSFGLNYPRIEPDTALFKKAVEDGLLGKDAELLPDDERDLKKLFFVPRVNRYANFFFGFTKITKKFRRLIASKPAAAPGMRE